MIKVYLTKIESIWSDWLTATFRRIAIQVLAYPIFVSIYCYLTKYCRICHNQYCSRLLACMLRKFSAPEPWINIKMLSYQYTKSYCGDKTVVRSSYLHTGISYTGKMSSLYWFRNQVAMMVGVTKGYIPKVLPRNRATGWLHQRKCGGCMRTTIHRENPYVMRVARAKHCIFG